MIRVLIFTIFSLRQGHRDAERYRGLLRRKERAREEPVQEDEESTASEGGHKGTGGAERIEGGHREGIVDVTSPITVIKSHSNDADNDYADGRQQ